jgi:hypothetical protein
MPSSQSDGVVRSWKPSTAGTKGSMASSGSTPSEDRRSLRTVKLRSSCAASWAMADLCRNVGASSASLASCENARSSP